MINFRRKEITFILLILINVVIFGHSDDEAVVLVSKVDDSDDLKSTLHVENAAESHSNHPVGETLQAETSESEKVDDNGGEITENASEIDNVSSPDVNVSVSTDAKAQGNETKNVTASKRATKVSCAKRNATESDEEFVVQILNSTALPSSFQTTPNATVAPCVLVLFFAPWCHFSAAAAPHYNALPRLFPDVSCLAISSASFNNLNARYGTIAVPTLLLFHNGLPVAKFNETQYTLENFVEFVKKNTGISASAVINVTSADFEGPLSSVPMQDGDYLLWAAWIFLIICCCFGFSKSTIWHRIVETLRNNWQEAEAQHEHND